jgi:hypothetical protein
MNYKNALNLFAGILFAAVALSAAPTAQAGQCSLAGAAGNYGFTLAGTLMLPTGGVPAAGVGRITIGADGNISGDETRSVGGSVGSESLRGTLAVKPDCTGTATFQVFASGQLVRTSVFALVFDDNLTELRAIQTSLVLPDGTSVANVITVEARRISPAGGE